MYVDAQPDYYEKKYTPEEYFKVLNVITNHHDEYLCVTDKGIAIIGLISHIFESIKALLGFSHNVDPTSIHAETLKFIYYGEVSGIIRTDNVFKLIDEAINSQDRKLKRAIKPAFKTLFDNRANENRDEVRIKLQELLAKFHKDNQNQLIPSLWQRLFTSNIIDSAIDLTEFGETYLLLAEKIKNSYGGGLCLVDMEKDDALQILNCIENAAKLDNASKSFQQKLAREIAIHTRYHFSDKDHLDYSEIIDRIYVTLVQRSEKSGLTQDAIIILRNSLKRFFKQNHLSLINETTKKFYTESKLRIKLIDCITKNGDEAFLKTRIPQHAEIDFKEALTYTTDTEVKQQKELSSKIEACEIPIEGELFKNCGDNYMKDNQFEVAKSNYQRALKYFHKDSPEALELIEKILDCDFAIGHQLFKDGRHSEALEIYGSVEKEYSVNDKLKERLNKRLVRVYLDSGETAHHKKEYVEAGLNYSKAQKFLQKNSQEEKELIEKLLECNLAIAHSHSLANNHSKAIEVYLEVQKVHGNRDTLNKDLMKKIIECREAISYQQLNSFS